MKTLMRPAAPGDSRRRGMVLEAVVGALILVAVLVLILFLFLSPGGPAPSSSVSTSPGGAAEPAPEAVAIEAKEVKAAAPSAAGAAVPDGRESAPFPPPPPGSLSGTVVSSTNGEPAAGVMVVVRREAPSAGEGFIGRFTALKPKEGDLSGLAGPDGRYRIEGLAAGDYVVFVLGGSTDFLPIPPAQAKKLEVPADLAPQELDLQVEQGGAISGKVLDPEGSPVPGAKASALPRDLISHVMDAEGAGIGFGEAVAGEDGSYRMGGLPLETEYLMFAEVNGKPRGPILEVLLSSEEPHLEVDLLLPPGCKVSGRVITAGGEPSPGIDLQLHDEGKFFFTVTAAKETKSDATGAFEFEGVGAGRLTVSALGGSGKAERAFDCDGIKDVSDLVLTMEMAARAGNDLAGRVIDDTGAGVADVKVLLNGLAPSRGPVALEAKSEADGSFAFHRVPEGMFNLMVMQKGYAPFLRTGVAFSPDPIEIALQRVARIIGVVVTKKGEEPVAGAVVKFASAMEGTEAVSRMIAGRLPGGEGTAKTGADGTFVLEGVVPGSGRVRAEANRYGPGLSRPFDLTPGGEKSGVRIEMSVGGRISGVVLDRKGQPVPGAAVQAVEVTGSKMEEQMRRMFQGFLGGAPPSARSDDDGIFQLRHLPEGKFMVSATQLDFSPSEEVEILLAEDGKRDDLRLTLRAPSSILIRVREKDKPLPDVMVQLIGAGSFKMSTTDSDGAVEFSNVSPGPYMVQVMDMKKMLGGSNVGMKQRGVLAREGKVEEPPPIVFGEGAIIRGKVRGPLPPNLRIISLLRPGAPKVEEMDLSDMGEAIRSVDFNAGMGMIGPDGSFTIPDVPEGEYIVEIPSIPTNDPMRIASMTPEEKKPVYRAERPVRISGSGEVTLPDIVIPERKAAPAAGSLPAPAATPPEGGNG